MLDTAADNTGKQRLRLLESVVTNTNDAVLITEIAPLDEPGPRIIYVNEAFTRMTGYTSDEVLGKSPRFLQGPLSDMEALHTLGECMRRFESCEVETINYKKNGELFWINFTVNPVADESGTYTHFIAIERDITERKVRELKRVLLSDIAREFYDKKPLRETLSKAISILAQYGHYDLAEIWLLNEAKDCLALSGFAEPSNEVATFYRTTAPLPNFKKGEGLPGVTWLTETIQVWDVRNADNILIRRQALEVMGMQTLSSLPLIHQGEMIGVIVVGSLSHRKSRLQLEDFLQEFQAPFCAEIKRKQLEEEQQRLFDFAPDAIVVADLNGYFRRVNRALSEMLGYSTEELLSRPFLDFVHADDVERTVEVMKNATSGDTIYSLENRMIARSGDVRWIAWTASYLVDDGFVHAVGKDITDKRKTEKAMLDALNEKQSILESIGDGFIAVDTEWNVVYWNASATRMLGLSRDEAQGRNLWDIYADAVDSEFFVKYQHAVTDRIPVHFEEFYPTLNKWFAIHAYPSEAGLSVYFQDVSARKVDEQALAESERRYSDVFHLSPVPMFIVDEVTLQFIDVNQAALQSYQYTPSEFLSMSVRDLRLVEDDEQLESTVTKTRLDHGHILLGPFRHRRKDGTTLFAEIRMHRFAYKGRNCMIVLATDVTERTEYMNTIESQNQTLREITWMQSHVVRAPLARIMSLVELADTQYPEEYARMDYLHALTTSAKELDVIIHEITAKANSLDNERSN